MKKKILVVDDDPLAVKLVRAKLERAGYVIHVAGHGLEALDSIKESIPDLIITDVLMPVMDGVDLYKALKKNVFTQNIPIIIITDNEVFERSFRMLGVKDFVPKPINAKRLLDVVELNLSASKTNERSKRVIILGTDKNISEDMARIIDRTNNISSIAIDGVELLSFALTLTPKLILIDVLMKGLKARELIKALRCFAQLANVPILIFAYFTPENLNDVEGLEKIKDYKDECLKAGATRYIGRFAQTTFISNVREFL